MTEDDYIHVTRLAMLRAILPALRDMYPASVADKVLQARALLYAATRTLEQTLPDIEVPDE